MGKPNSQLTPCKTLKKSQKSSIPLHPQEKKNDSLDTKTHSWAPGEWHKPMLEMFGVWLQPPFGDEAMGVWKDPFVCMDIWRAHTYNCLKSDIKQRFSGDTARRVLTPPRIWAPPIVAPDGGTTRGNADTTPCETLKLSFMTAFYSTSTLVHELGMMFAYQIWQFFQFLVS